MCNYPSFCTTFGLSNFFAITVGIVITSGSVVGQETTQVKIPAVGDAAPDFTLTALDAEPITLSKLTADSPVVLIVLRGYPGYQCPICSAQVGSLISRSKEIAETGARVVFVYPGSADNLSERATEFLKSKKLAEPFVLVTDPDYRFTEAYGLRWNAPSETVYPAAFVIDQQGKIRFAHVSMTHGGRAKTVDVLQALTSLK